MTKRLQVTDWDDQVYTETFQEKEVCENCGIVGSYTIDGDRNSVGICLKCLKENDPKIKSGWKEVKEI